jgi:transposase-like protein
METLEREVAALRKWREEYEKASADDKLDEARRELETAQQRKELRTAARNNAISQIIGILAIVAAILTAIFVR